MIEEQQDILQTIFDITRDDDPEVLLQKLGKELITRLFTGYRNVKIHSMNNEAVTQAIRGIYSLLTFMQENLSRDCNLMFVGQGVYLNRTLIKVDMSVFNSVQFLQNLFSELKIMGFTFSENVSIDTLTHFLEALASSPSDVSDMSWIGSKRFDSISIHPESDLSEIERKAYSIRPTTDEDLFLRIYSKLFFYFEEFQQKVTQGDFHSISHIQRTIHEMIDAVGQSYSFPLLVCRYFDSSRSFTTRSMAVTILALLLGKKLELSRRQLSDLGMAALLHDIGRLQISTEILQKTQPLDESEWKEIKKANQYSILQLIHLKGFNHAAFKRMVVAYEHSMDGTSAQSTTIFSRIVSICHCYIAMTSPQEYRDAFLPHEALKIMKKEEEKFDPLFFRAFFALVSSYPPGTLLSLSSGEVGIVLDAPEDRGRGKLPLVHILYHADGTIAENEALDLEESRHSISIQKVYEPHFHQIHVLALGYQKVTGRNFDLR